MNLKDFLAARDKPPELFWSVVLEVGWVQAGVWYIGDSEAEVVSMGPPVAWADEEDLIESCDAALSSVVAKLPENYVEPNKTVFGVASSWVKGGEIQDEHLAKIKKVCTELSLTPVGFVVLPEAIAHLIKSEEGSPLSAVILGLGTSQIEVTVFKLGNLVGTTSVARSVSISEDITEGLSRFEGVSPLPSRIIIYDGKGGELEEARDEIMKANWGVGDTESRLKFLHTPKAEILGSERKVIATSLAGAAEIGNITKVNAGSDSGQEELPIPSQEVENFKLPEDGITPQELGFAVDENPLVTSEISPPVSLEEKTVLTQEMERHIPQEKKKDYLAKTKDLFHTFSAKIKFSGPKLSPHPSYKRLYLVLGLIFAVILGALGYMWFIPKAQVVVYVAPKTYQGEAQIRFNTKGQYDESLSMVPAIIISGTASGDKTKSTTGSKLVGEKSSGSVQIANGNGNPIRLATGTVLTSASGLKFLTNTEASVSGQLIPGAPGTATLSVTAGDIGAQYNLAKGEVFKVGVFDKSQVAATSQADFSGGTSQQIAAVSEADQKSLSDSLRAELSGQIMEELAGKVTDEQIFINDFAEVVSKSQTYDRKIGETADTLRLTSTIEASGLAGDKAKLLQYTANMLRGQIPPGFVLRGTQLSFKFIFVGKDGDNFDYKVDIKANFLPMIDTTEMVKNILGKNTSSVDRYLKTVPGYIHSEIRIKPHLPGPFSLIPRLRKNISVEISSD